MGIICAALLVYGNMGRQGKLDESVPKSLQITELMQVEYHTADDKLEKFNPEVAKFDSVIYYLEKKEIVEAKSGKIVYDKKGIITPDFENASVPSYKEIDGKLEKIEVFTLGKALCDSKTKETIFNDKTLNRKYVYAGIFSNYVDEKTHELKNGFKIKTKVHSETMPFWIAFGCYLMIGLGTLMGGMRIVKTMGTKITKVTPLEGVCAETAGALTLFTVSQFGIPVSTTHTITGSIIGVGATKRLSAVRWGVTINLLWAWILTIPVSAALAALIYYFILLVR
jgi:PiT family inorganic phosphate transporter